MNNLIIPNIVDIVENNKIDDEYIILKEFEETIIDLYSKKTTSELFDNQLLLLTEINKYNKLNIKLYNDIDIKNIPLTNNIINNITNVVITGPYIRSVFVEKIEDIKNEVFVNCINNITYKDIIDDTFIESNDIYFKNINNFVIYIPKTIYKNPSEVILSNYNLKRVGLYNNILYVSTMFIVDYIKFKDTINSELIDPVYKTKLDLFDIYNRNISNKNNDIYDVINRKNYEEYKKIKINKYDIINFDKSKIYYNLNPCEYALYLYKNEQNDMIKAQLRLIILDLNTKIYLRSATFYAYILNIEELDNDLYDILKESKQYKQIMEDNDINVNIKNIIDINNLILSYYVKNDISNDFYNFLKYKDEKLNKLDVNIFNLIIDKDPKNIIINGIKNNYFSDRTKYKIILWTQNLDYFNLIGDDFNIDIAINYINEIVENCLIKSFYFLYKIDNSIINIVDSDNNNFLHNITEKNKYEDMILLLLKLDDSLLFKKNKLNQSPLLKHAKNNNSKIISYLINQIIDTNNDTLFELTDCDRNNILHYLCKSDDNLYLIRKILSIKKDIINYQNKNYETPIIISAIHSQENILYYLKSIGADLSICDIYGNIVYHYICLNDLCIGTDIENKENIFDYKPSDYCKISLNYYYFI